MPSERPAAEAVGDGDAAPGAEFEGHLHPLTLLFTVWSALKRIALLAVLAIVSRRQADFLLLAVIFMGPMLVAGLIRFLTFSYRLENGELVIRYGLIGRTERHIPVARVQDLRIDQAPMQRMLGVVAVHVETAGGSGGPEASLSVLSREVAEGLRSAVFARRAEIKKTGAVEVAEPEPPEVVKKLDVRELLIGGVTSTRLTRFFLMLAPLFALADQMQVWDEKLFRTLFERLGSIPGSTALLGAAILFVVMVIASVIGSAAWSVMVFYGFTLSKAGNDLHRAFGLFTRRESSLPRRRIQVLEVEEGFLRRLFGLAAIRADTAGGSGGEEGRKSGRDVLIPVLERSEVDPLLPVFFPGLSPDEPRYARVSPVAIRRGTRRAAYVLLLLTVLAVLWTRSVFPLAILLLIAPVYFLNLKAYRHLGYSDEQEYFRTRRGWLTRSTHVVPVRNVQAVSVHQTPFDRRYGVATLVVDTAGQAFTGGGPRISNLPEAEAHRLAIDLSRRAVRTRFRW